MRNVWKYGEILCLGFWEGVGILKLSRYSEGQKLIPTILGIGFEIYVVHNSKVCTLHLQSSAYTIQIKINYSIILWFAK